VHLEPGSLLGWLLVGLLGGWVAGQITRGKGFGCLGNLAIGIIGAFIGGLIFSIFDVDRTVGFVGSIAVATLGAVILLAVANLAPR